MAGSLVPPSNCGNARRTELNGLDRRQLLALGGSSLACWAASAAAGQAIEPIARQASKFKFSLAAYSYRDLLQGASATLTMQDFVDDCARFQLEGTELTSYYFSPDVTDDELRRLRRHCFRQGLEVSGTAIGNDFGFAPGEQREAQLQQAKRWIERAAVLGAPVIRIFAGHAHEGQSAEQTHKLMVAAIEECCAYAGQHGVHLALENHGGPTSTAAGLLKIVRDVQSEWFGVNLDTGNFAGPDGYGQIEQVAPYAVNVQVKVSLTGPQGERAPTDFARIAGILRAANYRGYVVLEFEEDGDPRSECPRILDQIRAAMTG